MSSENAAVAGISVGAVSLLGLLIATCVILTPLGNRWRHAKGERDNAKKVRDNANQALKTAQDNLAEAQQRVRDLDCAIKGYPGFNKRISDFAARIANSAMTATEQLQSFWQLHILPATIRVEHHTKELCYTTTEFLHDYYWSCRYDHCGDRDNTCCYAWGWHWEDVQHSYSQVTTIANHYNNILDGGNTNQPPLNCGYYPREFKTDIPRQYLAHETPHRTSGKRRPGGTVHVDYERFYGSKTSAKLELDATTASKQFLTSPAIAATSAATQLAQGLSAFLAAAIVQFDAIGPNYADTQKQIADSIPDLKQTVATASATLVQAVEKLAEKQNVFDTADAPYQHGLKLWLPLLFLAPCAAAVVAFCCYKGGENAHESYIEYRESRFTTLPKEEAAYQPPKPPAYSPKVFERPPATAPNNDTVVNVKPPTPTAPPYNPSMDGNQQPDTPRYS
ncbi:MAG: hypothetical protein P1U63_01720 [Coxiellaceae bacterium]|nr:hypothetical protein [Coxiellaceae bacterium]